MSVIRRRVAARAPRGEMSYSVCLRGSNRMQQTENLNVLSFDLMPSPAEVKGRLPLTELAAKSVLHGRRTLQGILEGTDRRVFVIVGPCSIHDPVAGLDYARRLRALASEVSETMHLVMRVYFEKPRTSL